MMPLFRWMTRGIAPLVGRTHHRLSLIYVDDLADAIIRWTHVSPPRFFCCELHDGFSGGYAWRQIIDAAARFRGGPVRTVRLPVPLVKAVAVLNLLASGITGAPPMLTPGKVRELTHPDWVADNTAIFQETGWVPRVSLAEGLRRTLSPPPATSTSAPFSNRGGHRP